MDSSALENSPIKITIGSAPSPPEPPKESLSSPSVPNSKPLLPPAESALTPETTATPEKTVPPSPSPAPVKPRFKPLLGNLSDQPTASDPAGTSSESKSAAASSFADAPTPKRKTSYMVAGVRKAEVNVAAATAPMEMASKVPLYSAWGAIAALSIFSLWQYQKIAALSEQSSGVAPSQSDASGLVANFKTELERVNSESAKRYQDVLAQFSAANQRLESSEQINARLETQVKDLLGQINLSSHLNQPTSSDAEGLESGKINVAELSPGHRELLLVKERNRITAFADTAIATAEREPYDRLWIILENPQLASLAHAARAEILRVQNFYLSGSRISRYDIAVGNYFPDQANLKDHQLTDAQLITLLEKSDSPWQVRLKAANLLGRRKSLGNAAALVKAVKEDSNLDVVKEATFSFEQITGYHARIFQTSDLEEWWNEYRKKENPSPSN